MRKRNERGSALMLVPAGILTLIALAAISVDAAMTFTGQRQLADTADAIANDAATAAFDVSAFRVGGDLADPELSIDLAKAQRLADNAVAANTRGGLSNVRARVSAGSTPGSVRVVVDGDVQLIFSKALPGSSGSRHVHATSETQLHLSR